MNKIIAIAFCAAVLLAGCAKKDAKTAQNSQEVKVPTKITKASDLVGKVIGVQAGTTGEDCAHEIKDAVVKSFKTGIDAAMALSNNAIDAILIDELPANQIAQSSPGLTIINGAFESEEYAVAVRKGDETLLKAINSTIQRIKNDGTYEMMTNSFMPIDGNITIPQVDFLDTPDVIKMGTNAAFPPFEYTEGNDIMGFDVTLGKLIAKDYDKAIKVIDMNFDALIAALQSGSVDFVIAGMTATDERRQNVDFSEPYYTSNQVIIVKE